jgi:hypothetical protein
LVIVGSSPLGRRPQQPSMLAIRPNRSRIFLTCALRVRLSGIHGDAPFATTHALLRQQVEQIVSNFMALLGAERSSLDREIVLTWRVSHRLPRLWNSRVRILPPQPASAVSQPNPQCVRKVATCPAVSPTLRSLCCAERSESQQDGRISAGSLSTRISNLQKLR